MNRYLYNCNFIRPSIEFKWSIGDRVIINAYGVKEFKKYNSRDLITVGTIAGIYNNGTIRIRHDLEEIERSWEPNMLEGI